MKQKTAWLFFLLLVFSACFAVGAGGFTASAPSGEGDNADKTLSPYFFVKSDDPAVDRLPLKSTSADVNISGVIADVGVAQVYKNEGKKAIEAVYVFPASTRAAVYGMKMTIGKRVIEAKIKERGEARREYEQARDQGKSASLLEQQRPNVFQMNVANIMPGDEIRVELKYTELLIPTDRVYEFIYPTVVGPRYSNAKEETSPPSERWIKNPYLHEGEEPPYSFNINVNLAAGMSIGELTSTSHKVNVAYDGPATAKIALDKSEKSGGNRDYILRYRLAGNKVQSGLLTFQGEKENFFLLMLQPPKQVALRQIPGREYIFIVDVSGSMHGFPLEISKKLLKDLIGNLRSTDRFNVLLFSGGSTLMSPESLPATQDNINRAIHVIDRQQGGGGTELLPALKKALSFKRTEGVSRTVIIATDGYVSVEEEAFDLIRNRLGDANMFAFGIGTSVNRHLIEGMAHVGMGEPFVVTRPDEANSQAERFRTMVASPVLTGIKTQFKGFAVHDVEPASIPDVLADRPVIVFGKWTGKPKGAITVTGTSGNGPYSETIDVSSAAPSPANGALKYLWARHRITLLADYNNLRSDEKRIKEITQLGLSYNLLTAYTSFVAVDSQIRNKDGRLQSVTQPLPLPQGVSDYAVGGSGGYLMMTKNTAPMAAAEAPPRQDYARSEKKEKDKVPGKTRAGSTILVDNVIVSGGLVKETISKTITEYLKKAGNCAEAGAVHGRMDLSLKIKTDGSVQSIKVISHAFNKNTAPNCITASLKKLVFPANAAETQATVTLIFN